MLAKTANDIGLIIRERRREKGLDQAELARQVGVSRHWVIDIEKGRAGAELGLVLRTLRVLDIDLHLESVGAASSDPPTGDLLASTLDRARKRDD